MIPAVITEWLGAKEPAARDVPFSGILVTMVVCEFAALHRMFENRRIWLW